MTELAFVDSNILVYAHDTAAGDKRTRASIVIQDLWQTGAGRISPQVLQEVYVTITQKLKSPIARPKAREIVTQLGHWVREPTTVATVLRATELADIVTISFWDALIVASAEQAGAVYLYTEDLNHGQVIAGVKIINPFAA